MTGASLRDRSVVNGAASVSALRASVPSANDFMVSALKAEIETMLEELGQPELVGRIFPKGWRNADRRGLIDLYELCRRTFNKRGQSNG